MVQLSETPPSRELWVRDSCNKCLSKHSVFTENYVAISTASLFPFRYEFQMQYGSIGWSVGATLGYAQAAKDKRVIACIGDGSFQVSIIMFSETCKF